MADLADKAQVQNDMMLKNQLKQRKSGGPSPIGMCHYCEEPLSAGERFCDVECRDCWQDEQRFKGAK